MSFRVRPPFVAVALLVTVVSFAAWRAAQPRPFRACGAVVDELGRSVAGADIAIEVVPDEKSAEKPVWSSTQDTGLDGRFCFTSESEPPHSPFRLTVSQAGFASVVITQEAAVRRVVLSRESSK